MNPTDKSTIDDDSRTRINQIVQSQEFSMNKSQEIPDEIVPSPSDQSNCQVTEFYENKKRPSDQSENLKKKAKKNLTYKDTSKNVDKQHLDSELSKLELVKLKYIVSKHGQKPQTGRNRMIGQCRRIFLKSKMNISQFFLSCGLTINPKENNIQPKNSVKPEETHEKEPVSTDKFRANEDPKESSIYSSQNHLPFPPHVPDTENQPQSSQQLDSCEQFQPNHQQYEEIPQPTVPEGQRDKKNQENHLLPYDVMLSECVSPTITKGQLLTFCQENNIVMSKTAKSIKNLQTVIIRHLFIEATRNVDVLSVTKLLHQYKIKPNAHMKQRVGQLRMFYVKNSNRQEDILRSLYLIQHTRSNCDDPSNRQANNLTEEDLTEVNQPVYENDFKPE